VRFETPEWLLSLWAAPVLVIIALWAVSRRTAQVRRFVEESLRLRIAPGMSATRPMIRALLLVTSLALVGVALSRPQWNPRPQEVVRKGRDVCFLIDVSRSMLAEDLAPNRLERSKLWVLDAMSILRGDRVAIVPFAGTAVVKCPLTHDYGFARMSLADVSPSSVARGGTLMGDALRTVLAEVFESEEPSFKDVILITDGEDHESFPVEAAKGLAQAGVRLIAIGVGDETQGRPIPITDEQGRQRLLTYQGQTVYSKLDGPTLREMVGATPGGVYFNVATGTIELDKVYKRLIQQAEQKEMAGLEQIRYDERFQIFLAAALVLLFLEGLINERRAND